MSERGKTQGWTGLIHLQRRRRVECEIEKASEQIRDYWEAGDGFHTDRLLDRIGWWLRRDPFDESHWIHEET